ncbi:NAD-binding Rossmann fold oxidoreductase family protein [Amniculicola lignicola CBS 123094]|uniref:NAD-binding Rossmann fold oxidoreductase family protein n=1 Tax=Amniculicola lignicola CBS 123094 TaxID=1392246 RepID=A0A6A5W3Y8_9PLEO|nr:NAD-binding Rossmann fold oxidoreductase family protein [Amniculicola lignicola CBS 123094]
MSSNTQPKRVGTIGLSGPGSWASRAHIVPLKASPHYTITALQNRTKESANAAATCFDLGPLNVYDDPKSLAQDPNVDIVAVSVKVPHHYEAVKPAIEAGKDVFVEWPLARNLAEAKELAALAKAKGIRTMVGLQGRKMPAAVRAKALIDAGKIGTILGTHMYAHGAIWGAACPENLTYGLPVENGANQVTIAFGHLIDTLCWVVGEVESFSATLANNRPQIPIVTENTYEPTGQILPKTAHDYVSITGKLVCGGVVDATCSGGLSRAGKSLFWEIEGTKGTLILEGGPIGSAVQMFPPTLRLYVDGDAEGEEIELEKVEGAAKGDYSYATGKAWAAWAAEDVGEGYPVVTFEDAVVRHRMIDAVYRSAETGARVTYL